MPHSAKPKGQRAAPGPGTKPGERISDEDLLDLVQRQTFRYFWDGAHPVSGLARDRCQRHAVPQDDAVAIGGSGFGLLALIVACALGFITREQALARLSLMLDCLEAATCYHGMFPHFMRGDTGATIPFSRKDDGADIVETSYLFKGLLCVRAYFDRDNEAEARLQAPPARALRSHVVLRSRYAEDRLALAVARGVRQYVVLGAGYDTFIVRQPLWAAALRITEVDRAAIQQAKRARLAEVGLIVPGNVTFLEMDFETETLAAGLERGGVNRSEPAFFSWLGVSVYLTEAAIDAVLATVAAYPAGSEIVFTFSQPRDPRPDVRPDASGDGEPTLADRVAAIGEPWLSYFSPEAMEEKLLDAGFRDVEFLTPDAARAAYSSGAAGELPPPRRTAIASALR